MNTTTTTNINSFSDAQAPVPFYPTDDDHLDEFARSRREDDEPFDYARYAWENGHAEARHFGKPPSRRRNSN